MQILTNARIFTGKDWITNGTVITENGRIVSVTNESNTDPNSVDCGGNLLVPAFIDLQIYGAGGRLFAAYPDAESLTILAEENRKSGAGACLVTIATQPIDVIYKCIAAIKEYWKEGGKGIMGMHLEGPFINPVKRGAHVLEWIHEPTEKEVLDLLAIGKGVIKMVTLAPEVCKPAIINLFIEAGIVVAAGHCNATYEQAMNFSSLGIKTITHLFNAMSPLHHRDTGLPGAAFENQSLRASIIPDGIHVSYSALRIAKKQMNERLYFITDAVTETRIGEYKHQFYEDHYCVPDGTLSGSALTMLQGIKNAIQFCDISLEESLRMAALYPAQVMGLEADYGTIAAGRKSSMLLMDKQLNILQLFFPE